MYSNHTLRYIIYTDTAILSLGLVLSVSIAALAIPIVFRVAFVVSTTAVAISLIVPRSFRSLTVSFTSFTISRIAIVVSSIARAISSNAPVLTSVISSYNFEKKSVLLYYFHILILSTPLILNSISKSDNS